MRDAHSQAAAASDRRMSLHACSAGRRPSLVDWVSFEVMRRRGLDVAFDRDFAARGFDVVD